MNQIKADVDFAPTMAVPVANQPPTGVAGAGAGRAGSPGQPEAGAPAPTPLPRAPSPTVAAQPRAAPPRLLTEADLRMIHAALIQGDDALARRKDLGEMHKRFVAMITTLQQGLGEAEASRASADRAAVVARLDQVERAINSMEAALRIELEPMLQQTVHDMIAQSSASRKPILRKSLMLLIAALALLAIGASYSEQIQTVSKTGAAFIAKSSHAALGILSPNGGISNLGNQVD